MSGAIITADHVSKWYGQVIGLNDVSVTIPAGITGLLGPNGAGKSTFMKLITGQLKPSKGNMTVLGGSIWNNPAAYMRIGFCPEQDAFYERMNQIEDHFAGKRKDVVPLQIGRSWYRRWSSLGAGKMLQILFWPHVAFPHVLVVVLGVVLFVLQAGGHAALWDDAPKEPGRPPAGQVRP